MKRMIITIIMLSIFFSAYANGKKEPFHKTVEYVDIHQFAGDWHVIALIPTPFEKGAVDGLENYSFDSAGNIRVEYTFRKGVNKLIEKVMYQKGWLYDRETNAEWRVQPLWPLRLPYYIMELDEEYSYTVIGTNNFKYLWIMSRNSSMDSGQLNEIIGRMVERGFDREKIMMMEQTGGQS